MLFRAHLKKAFGSAANGISDRALSLYFIFIVNLINCVPCSGIDHLHDSVIEKKGLQFC